MGEIVVVRHGETEWNREQVFRGRADMPLSERGRWQARRLAEALEESSLEAVYSSPLARARETAEAVAAALGMEAMVDERLTDMSFGEWEGKRLGEVQERWPELYETWVQEPERFRAPGGESLTEVVARAWPAMEEIAARHSRGAVMVAHRVVCKVLLCAALAVGEEGFWRVRVETGSVSVLERVEMGWRVVMVNDTCHLRGMGERDRRDF